MRGVGGPLLCIGDLLSDVGESDASHDQLPPRPTITPSPDYKSSLQPSDLNNLFQENYEQLNKALAGTDHSWTHLTLELCTALETASKLVHSTNSSVGMLKDKVEELSKVISRRDSAIEAAKAIEGSPKQPESTQ
ncbi:uncharacterized protein LOC107817269 [Nicotiana tabacum]|uniref:Uncharacterized protein n=2 Tax=Nicotiana tabacum TaxID=4097 RepID=A0A1S4CBP0_TOBAC|nr:PREDICTED: uncharacterized protein LOC107817269 [Nicotiana tabacum]XP_016498558.1 PREDICTED: uncharacterized protein LOC107817269 [Nicotiana tabacum]XP_016498559.1 PREDICTED: uncharacterized protein LOC107817269 [Nicotiana tabacum]